MTLVIVLAFVCLWMRSLVISDIINVPFDTSLHTLYSRNGYIDFRRIMTGRVTGALDHEVVLLNGKYRTRLVTGEPARTLVEFRTVIMSKNWDGDYQDMDFMRFDRRPRIQWTTTTQLAVQSNGFAEEPAAREWHLWGIEYIRKCRANKGLNAANNPVQFDFLSVPYWSFAIPLTLLSSCFLCSKSGKQSATCRSPKTKKHEAALAC